MKKIKKLSILLMFALLVFAFGTPTIADAPIDRSDPNYWCFIDGINCTYIWDGQVYIVGNMHDMGPIDPIGL